MKLIRDVHLCELGASLVPFSGIFIGQRDREQSCFAPTWSYQLQADRQAVAREPARNRNRWVPREISWSIQTHES